MNTSKLLLVMLLALGLMGLTAGLSARERQVSVADFPNQTRILNNSDFGFEVEFKVGDLKVSEIKTKNSVYDELSIANYGFTGRLGEPKLPVLSKLIAVPVGATVSFDVLSRTHQTLSQTQSQLANQIIPAQRSISKSEDPEQVPFALNEAVYGLDAFTDNKLFTLEEVGFMRGVRVFQIYFEPVRYNPVSGEIIVSNDVLIRVNFSNPDFGATEELLARTASHEFIRMYEHSLFNWDSNSRTSIVRYPTKMLILCPSNYTDEMASYVTWKTQQGYQVTVTTVGTGGTVANTTSAITTYMQSVWAAATAENPAPTYLLIVGDTSTSGDNIIAPTGATGSHPTDLTYVRLQGTDYVPEMYYGRFSAASATELTNIINKTVTFEKTQMPDLSYLGNVVMIAGVDATFGPTHGNGAINYGTQNYFNSTFGITSNTYLYPASGSSDAQVIANANQGRGYINYTAHGSQTSWADPTFTVTDVNNMTNTNKYGVMVGNCCLTNQFTTSVCFGESIIRKANAGGVAYIGGTNNTYWDEDYWWAVGAKGTATGTAPAYDATKLGVYDAMFHTHGEAFTDWAQTAGDVIWMGNLAVSQGASSLTNYYWEIYSIMGDPSLYPYYGVPTANTASYSSTIFLGATTYAVTGAAPYSRIGLTKDGVIYGTGITNAAGNLTLTITPFTSAGTAKLVITAQNKITVIADITVAAQSGPYMTVEAVNYDDANNDVPDYNESGYLDVTFKNVGISAANNVTATLSCSTTGITITDNTHFISSLAAGASVLADNAYAITIANNVANGTTANFTLTMVGSDTWTHNFNLTLNAPALAFGSMTISDPSPGNNNGRLDPGETVTITMPLNNTGGAASEAGNATLTCSTPGITVNTGTANFSAIPASGSTNLTFNITASSGITNGTAVQLVFNASAGAYTANKTETTAIGLVVEDFESGSFSAYPWTFSGNQPWTIVNTGAHTGTYCAKSGTIVANQTSTMQFVRNITSPEKITFWYKVSSESNYDFLRFYVDGSVVASWSGEVAWTQYTYTLAAGNRTLAWTYSKDGSVDTGSDCAWVDDVICAPYIPPTITWTPSSFTQSLAPNQTASQNLTIGNTGNETLTYTVSKPTGGSTVLDETFATTSIPTGWTQEYVTGTTPWVFATGGYNNTNPSSAYDGTYNARLYYGSSTGITSKLVTPALNLSGYTTATLTFYHTQALWVSDQDELKVYYKTSSGGTWTQLAHYTSNITAWTLETINLPNLSGSYYIAFEGIAKYGYAVCVDKVVVTATGGAAVPWLTVAGGNSYSGSITGGANQNVTIGFNSAGLSVGTYNSTLSLSSNSTTNSSVSIPVELIVSSVAGPAISVDPGSLNFESIAVGASDIKTFTIQNTGGETLTGSITTPTGYSVALAPERDNSSRDIAFGKTARNTLAYSINASQSKTYNVTFAPQSIGTYNGNIAVTSNDPGNPSVNVSVTGSAYAPPTATLGTTTMEMTLVTNHTEQTSFTICNNGSIDLNYSLSIPGAPAWLVCIPMSSVVEPSVCFPVDVTYDATGLNAGTYNAQIIVNSNDPANPSQAIDVTLNVQLTNVAEWVPVTYPNNSATVYGVVTVDWANCQPGDAVAAFVGDECRAAAEVTMNGDTAYVTLLVNLASAGETVSFKVYDYTADTVYPVLETYSLNFGQVIGSPVPVPINGVSSVALEAPVVTVSRPEGSVMLNWEAVAGAAEYHIYRSLDPYGTYSQIGTTAALQYEDTAVFDRTFYYVKAVTSPAALRN